MLPLQQAYEVKHSILEYLKATFSFKNTNITSNLYQGKKIIYCVLVDKCDLVEDYKLAVEWFEGVFGEDS